MGSPFQKKPSPFSGDEWEQVFEAVASGGGEDTLKGLRRQLSDRDRVTVVKAYKTAREFELSQPDRMIDVTADQISQKVGYSATFTYVQGAFLKWRAWRGHQGEKRDEAFLDEICRVREDVSRIRRYFEFIMPHILGSSHVHTDDTLMMLTTTWTGPFRGGMHAWEWDQSEGVNGTLKLGVENDPMFPMLREHLADRSFGYIFDAWKRSVEYLLWLCRELSSEMTLVCQQQTGASVLKAGARSRDTLFWEFSRQVYRRQLLRAEGRGEGPHFEYEFAQSGVLWVLKLGNRRLAVHPDRSVLSDWRDTHRELVTDAAWSRAIENILRQHEEVRSRSRELRAALRGLS